MKARAAESGYLNQLVGRGLVVGHRVDRKRYFTLVSNKIVAETNL